MNLQIKSINDLTDLEKISLVDFSYSRIDTYKSCPSKYFYTYIQKEPRGFAEAATLRKYCPFRFGRMHRARD